MAKVKIGIVGCGVMGSFHTKTASELKEEKLMGVHDPIEEKAKSTAEKYATIPLPFLEELMKEVEALIIASPTSTHFEIAKKALEQGLHILIEKPLTQDSTRGEELVNLAKAKNKVLAVGMIERFNPAFSKALSIVKKEKILGLEIKRFSPLPERITDANVIWDVMIHDLDLAVLLSKTEVDSIKATGKRVKTKALDEANATLYFKDGMIAKISASRVKDRKERIIQITTDKAIYDVDLLNKKLYTRNFDTLIEKTEIEFRLEDQLKLEQKDFCLSIRKNRNPRCSGREALSIIKLTEEVEKQCSYQ